MNTKELIGFLQVCKDKSITKAAKALEISPQGLSKIIKNLERELDAELFQRTISGIEITQCGQAFEKRASQILREMYDMNNEIKNVLANDSRNVKLVSAYEVLRYLTPDCIINFKKENKDINLSYQEYPDKSVDDLIFNNEADIGFTIGPVDEECFEKRLIKSFRVYLLVNKSHPLVHKKIIKYKDLQDVDLIFESNLFKVSNIIKENLKKQGVNSNIIFEASGFSLCHKLCDMNKGVSFTVDFVNEDLGSDNTVLIPLEDESLKWSIYMIRRKDLRKSYAVGRFEEFVLNWISKKM